MKGIQGDTSSAEDRERIGALVAHHSNPVRDALLAHFGPRMAEADIDDAVQAAIAQIWLRRRAYSGSGVNLRALLFTIAHNELINRWRASRREQAALRDIFAASNANGSASDPDIGHARHLHVLLQTVIAEKLTADEREILMAWVNVPPGEAWTGELSDKLKLSPGHLRVYHHRILSKLRSAVTPGVLSMKGYK